MRQIVLGFLLLTLLPSMGGAEADGEKSEVTKDSEGLIIESFDASKKLSVYRDIAKVGEHKRKLFSRGGFSGFSDKQCRQFGYDYTLVSEFERSRVREAFSFAYFVIYHLLEKFPHENPKVLAEFKEIITEPVGYKVGDFLLTVVPRYSFPEMQIVMSGEPVGGEFTMVEYAIQYAERQERPTTKLFYRALDDLWDADPKTIYQFRGGQVTQKAVNSYLKVLYAFFKNYYLPVFEISLYNPSIKPVEIQKVGVEVFEYEGYLGSRNFVPETNLLSIDVPSEKGTKTIELSKPLEIGSKKRRTVNVRLAPTGKEAAYVLSIKFYYNSSVLDTEKITFYM